MTDDLHQNGWTLATLNRAMRDLDRATRDLIEERRVQTNERFRLLEQDTLKADQLLAEYKKDSNEYRSTFLPIDVYRAEYRQLIARTEQVADLLRSRLDAMNTETSKIKDDVITLKSRSGYVSTAMMISVVSALGALAIALIHAQIILK